MNDFLRGFLNRNLGVEGELLDILCESADLVHVDKEACIIEAGHIPRYLDILVDGVAAGCYDGTFIAGELVVSCFCTREGDFPIPPHDLSQPSSMTIKAVADTRIVRIPLSVIEELISTRKDASEIYNRKLTQALHAHSKIKILSAYGGIERCLKFMQEFPGLMKLVAHKYIASYLGLREPSLSRLLTSIHEGDVNVLLEKIRSEELKNFKLIFAAVKKL